jgi:NitT/TauT family transport system substrate-binding protein
MDEQFDLGSVAESSYTRSDLLKRAAGAAAGATLVGGLFIEEASARSALTTVLWVPIKTGYYKKLGLNIKLNAGGGTNEMQLVAGNQIDVGYPSPGILTSSIDADIPVISVFEQIPYQVFDFVLPAKSKITSPKQLAGKTIALFTDGWSSIVNPMLAEVGVNPKSVKYRVFGPQWVQAVALGRADAGLVWEGLRAQLVGQSSTFGSAFQLKFLVGSKWGSKGPSNSYAVRKADLDDAKKRDVYIRFLAGSVYGSEFAKANPRAAAQITYGALPALQKLISPQVALESMLQLATGYSFYKRHAPHLYGWHDAASWNRYLNAVAKLGQTKRHLSLNQVLTNDLIRPANQRADVALARRQARAFKVNEFFRTTKIPSGYPL